MVRKSKGLKNHTRDKLKKDPREKGLTSITDQLRDYSEGDMVHIDIDPSVHDGMPHPRFQGRTGEVVEKRGRAFVVHVTDVDSTKELAIMPAHLKPMEG